MTFKLSKLNPSKRLYLLLIAIIVLLIAALIGGAYGANSLLGSQAAKLTDLKAKSQALAQEQTSFVQAKKEVQKYADLDRVAQAIVPEDKDQAEAVREIVNIAGANNVSLASITFPPSTLGGNGPVSAAHTATPTPAAVSASPGASTSKLSQLAPVPNIPGVYQLQIVVQSDQNHAVTYGAFINFLTALEHNRRTAQISNIAINPLPKNHSLLTFSLTLNEYIKP